MGLIRWAGRIFGSGTPYGQEHWFESVSERLASMPDSNGCRYYEKLPYKIGLVCDEFFYESIRSAAEFVYLAPGAWRAVLDEGIDALLFVSAWHGLRNDEWKGLAALPGKENERKREAFAILDRCREKDVPVIFYSKEDPPNFEYFAEYAKKSDIVFTSAEECIPEYRSRCGHDRIQSLCFGIDPLLHNPIGIRSCEKIGDVLFSGSWMRKYPERCRDLAMIFDGIIASGRGLHIIDRNYPGRKEKIFRFPKEYARYCSPSVPHGLLQKVHKLADWAVNINSVMNSATMFANRVFELQACGVLLLSNESAGVRRLFPHVTIVRSAEDAASALSAWDACETYERQIYGIRSVMTGHTCYDRMNSLLKALFTGAVQPARNILVLADSLTENVRQNFDRQTYPGKTLAAACDVTPEMLACHDMTAWFSSDAAYGEHYLEDMSNAFKYTSSRYATKDSYMKNGVPVEGKEHCYTDRMPSKYRTVFWNSAFEPAFILSVPESAGIAGGYSTDRFNYDSMPCQTIS
ncbi:MAG: glycosyltransferase [Mailhella sp.]|nr:glycosyltransferase [Mailhella sp.]